MYILGYRQINCFYHVLYNYYNQNEKSLIDCVEQMFYLVNKDLLKRR